MALFVLVLDRKSNFLQILIEILFFTTNRYGNIIDKSTKFNNKITLLRKMWNFEGA